MKFSSGILGVFILPLIWAFMSKGVVVEGQETRNGHSPEMESNGVISDPVRISFDSEPSEHSSNENLFG